MSRPARQQAYLDLMRQFVDGARDARDIARRYNELWEEDRHRDFDHPQFRETIDKAFTTLDACRKSGEYTRMQTWELTVEEARREIASLLAEYLKSDTK